MDQFDHIFIHLKISPRTIQKKRHVTDSETKRGKLRTRLTFVYVSILNNNFIFCLLSQNRLYMNIFGNNIEIK